MFAHTRAGRPFSRGCRGPQRHLPPAAAASPLPRTALTSPFSHVSDARSAKLIGYMWRDESPTVRKHYEAKAAEAKVEHAAKYPGKSRRSRGRSRSRDGRWACVRRAPGRAVRRSGRREPAA